MSESVRLMRNAFHVLGLSTGVDLKEIKLRGNHLLNLARIEETEHYETDLQDVKQLRSEQNVRKALEQLTSAKYKLIETFFWFETPTLQDHKALKNLASGNFDESLRYWRNLSDRSPNWIAKKNEAMASFVWSYQIGEAEKLESSLKIWREIAVSDEFWKFYIDHYEMTDDFGTNESTFHELRVKIFDHISWLVLDLYRKRPDPTLVQMLYNQTKTVGEGIETFVLNEIILKINEDIEILNDLSKVKPLDPIRLRTGKISLLNKLSEISAFGIDSYSPVKTMRENCASKLRSISIAIHNETEELSLSKEFIEAGATLSTSESYLLQLERDREQLKKNEEHQEARIKELSYEIELGLVFKDKFKISPSGMSWNNQRYDLKKITRIRWGGIRKSVNGIPAGTSYTIAFGDEFEESVINNASEKVYQIIIQKIWAAVGVQIMTNILENLRKGNKIQFGDSVIDDVGIELTKHNFFSTERVYLSWNQVRIYNADGNFMIAAADNKKIYSTLSYINCPNSHAIEACIRAAFKNWKGKLSGLLGS